MKYGKFFGILATRIEYTLYINIYDIMCMQKNTIKHSNCTWSYLLTDG